METGAKDRPLFSFEQSVFAAGVATVPDPRLLSDGQYASGRNCITARSGRIRKRNGHSALAVAPEAAPVRHIERIVTDSGKEFVLTWIGNKLYLNDGDTHVNTILASDIDETGDICAEWWHDKLFYSDGVTGLRYVSFPSEDIPAWASKQYGEAPNIANLKVAAKEAGAAGNGIVVNIVVPEVDGAPWNSYDKRSAKPLPVVTVVDGVITVTVWKGVETYESIYSGLGAG